MQAGEELQRGLGAAQAQRCALSSLRESGRMRGSWCLLAGQPGIPILENPGAPWHPASGRRGTASGSVGIVGGASCGELERSGCGGGLQAAGIACSTWLGGDSGLAGARMAGALGQGDGQQGREPRVEDGHGGSGFRRRTCLRVHRGAGEQDREEEERGPHGARVTSGRGGSSGKTQRICWRRGVAWSIF